MKIIASAFFVALLGWYATAAADIADDILARAIDRYRAGDVEPAIGGINAALRGRLSGDQLAKAYYYRGLAHRKAGQPGQAITDLTRALDYPGLTDAERSDARENLGVAYQEAGIAPDEKVVVARTGNDVPRTASTAAPSLKPGIVPPPTTVTGSVETPAKLSEAPGPAPAKTTAAVWQTATESTPAQPGARSASWDSQQVALAPLPPVPKPAKSQKQAAAAVPPTERPRHRATFARSHSVLGAVCHAGFGRPAGCCPSPGRGSAPGWPSKLAQRSIRTRRPSHLSTWRRARTAPAPDSRDEVRRHVRLSAAARPFLGSGSGAGALPVAARQRL